VKKISNDNVMTDPDLWKLLDNTRFAIARLRGMELSQFGLTLEQSSILRTLYENNGPLTTKELTEVTMRQPNSISILVNRMIKMGLIKTEKSKSRKRHQISLTQDGENIIKNVTMASIEMSFSSLKAEEKQLLSVYLNSLLKNARALLGIPQQPPFMQYLMQNKPGKESVSE
jgi:DNA-binding MarR family transcriptional regulator